MFQLVNSLWLWGLAALSVPLLIHLWNIRQGKVLKVGSIALMAAASKKISRSFKLTDWLLLIIRGLLLALVALLLARPVWQQRMAIAKTKGWVLIPKELIAEVYQHYKPQLDSLHKAGFELHEFNAGFKAIDSLQFQKLVHTSNILSPSTPANYWMLLNRLNSKLAAATPVYLFTTAQLKHFDGPRPQTALNLHWQTFTPADSATTWIHQAWFTPEDHIRVVTGTSRAAGTTYAYHSINAAPSANSPFRLQTENGRLILQLKNEGGTAITVNSSVQHFAIYTDKYTADAGYIKAALQTVMQFSQRKAVIQQYRNSTAIPGQQDWLFWLSEQPISAAASQQAKHVLRYAPGKAAATSSWINFAPEHVLADQGPALNLYKSIPAGHTKGKSVWTDGFGQPLLSRNPSSPTTQYNFYSRFNPAWSDLVWDERFPQVLLQLITPPVQPENVYDRRVLSRSQLMPATGSSTFIGSAVNTKQTDLRLPVWLLLALLFLTERLLAHRTKTNPSHG